MTERRAGYVELGEAIDALNAARDAFTDTKSKVDEIHITLTNESLGLLTCFKKLNEDVNGNGKKGLKQDLNDLKGDLKVVWWKVALISFVTGLVLKGGFSLLSFLFQTR